jgi:hypothetical protein
MTTFVEQVHLEVLRCLYALSLRRWPAVVTELALLALAATFVFAAWRLLGAGGSRTPRSAAPSRENA